MEKKQDFQFYSMSARVLRYIFGPEGKGTVVGDGEESGRGMVVAEKIVDTRSHGSRAFAISSAIGNIFLFVRILSCYC